MISKIETHTIYEQKSSIANKHFSNLAIVKIITALAINTKLGVNIYKLMHKTNVYWKKWHKIDKNL